MALYSHSRLSTFEQCPLKFKYAYIDKIETEIEDTVEAFLGSRVHDTLEKLYKDLKFQKINTLQELLDFFNEEWKKNWNPSILIVKNEYDEENYRKMGEQFITDYHKRYYPFNQSKTIGLETKYTADLGEGHTIHIRIDRLAMNNDMYEIHDYKTSNSLPTQEDLDTDRQLAVYAYGIKKMYPDARKIKLIWHYLAFDKEMTSERTDEQLDDLKKDVLLLIKEIQHCREFPAKESPLCAYCQFQSICPKFKHLYSLNEKEHNEYLQDDGVQLVNKYASISEEIKLKQETLEEIKEALLQYAEKQHISTVFGSDIKASIVSYPRLSFPKRGDVMQPSFIATVKAIGLWDKLSTVDAYELAKMINNKEIHSELIKLIDTFIKKEKTTMIKLGKKS
jgi:putative RecB family exonuclease